MFVNVKPVNSSIPGPGRSLVSKKIAVGSDSLGKENGRLIYHLTSNFSGLFFVHGLPLEVVDTRFKVSL